ncbi:MAG: hypothetical protein IJG13_07295 [Kiritimatiellae bacterium]|nr:hypothetical protein [Kiritimatiellia bacterium]
MNKMKMLATAAAALAVSCASGISVYEIPAGTTYTLASPDPNIASDTVVDVGAGATLDLNGLSAAWTGLTGSGAVVNGTLTLSLDGGPYTFRGTVDGTLKFARSSATDDEFGFVVGASNTLAAATVHAPVDTVNPIRFGGGVGWFYAQSYNPEKNCTSTLRVEDVDGEPVSFVTGLNNSYTPYLKVTGSGSFFVNGDCSLSSTTDFTGLTGTLGVLHGRAYLNVDNDLSSVSRFVVDHSLLPDGRGVNTRLHTGESSVPLVFAMRVEGRGDSTSKIPQWDLERPVELKNPRLARMYPYINVQCTNFTVSGGYVGMLGMGFANRTLPFDFVVTNAVVGGSFITDYGNTSSLVPMLGYVGPAASYSACRYFVRNGGELRTTQYAYAPVVEVGEGGLIVVSDRYARSASVENELRFLGGRLKFMKANAANSNVLFNNDNANCTVRIGEKGLEIEAECDGNSPMGYTGTLPTQTAFRTLGGIASDGGVTIRDGGFTIVTKTPFYITGDFRVRDGIFTIGSEAMAKAETDGVPVLGQGDFVVGNALIWPNTSSGAVAESSRLVYEGAATVRLRNTSVATAQAVAIGPADAAPNSSLVRRGRGTIVFADWYRGNSAFDKSLTAFTVNGGLATDASGRVKDPVFTLVYPHVQYTSLDFAALDGNGRIVPFDGYETDSSAWTAGKVAKLASSETLSESKAVAAINVFRSTLTIPEGMSLVVGNGVDPACVILDNYSSYTVGTIAGGGTLDFGTSEGVVMTGMRSYSSAPALVSATISGSGGLTISGGRCGVACGLRLSAANTYVGGTYVNGVGVEPYVDGAFSTGDVYLGPGRYLGGQIMFKKVGVTITNAVHGCGFGTWHSDPDMNSNGMITFGANAELAGPLELTGKARIGLPESDVTGTISGPVSGGRLQCWGRGTRCRLDLSGENVHTGGTEAVRCTVACVGNGNRLGTGDVKIDGGVLRFENTAAITVTNRIWGVGTIQLAGAPVTFTNIDDDDNVSSLTVDVAGGLASLQCLPATVTAVTNSSGTASVLAVTSGIGRMPASVSANVELRIGEGATLDLDWKDVTVAKIGGSGAIRRGVLTVTGEIHPGGEGAVGTLTLARAPVSAGATLVAEAGDGGVDKLVVGGDFDASSLALRLTALGACKYAAGDLLVTSGALTGAFDPVTKPAKGSWTLSYGPNVAELRYMPRGMVFVVH